MIKSISNQLHTIVIIVLVSIAFSSSLCAQTPPPYPIGTAINYVRTWDAVAPEQDFYALITRSTKDVKQTTQYIDGIGRPLQTVIKEGSLETTSGIKTDVVSPVLYDEFGREQFKYLPFVSNQNNGSFKLNPFQQQVTFMAMQYSTQSESHFYSKANFEPSPLNRPTDTYAPGTSWAGSETATPALQRNVQMKYFINTITDDVKIWNVNNDPVIGNFGTYTTSTFYPAGELYKNITIDEHKKQVIEFKDKEGKVILKKVQIGNITDNGAGVNNNGFLCTYYIYDDLNNLRCVIQPEGVKLLLTNGYQLTTILLAEQCFRYEYDARNRMVKKKVPGAEEVCMVYDERDRLILMQDANMRVGIVKWMYTKYDELNRPIANGLWPSPLTYTQHAGNTVNNLAYPVLAGEEELSRTFYDNYIWLANYATGLSATYNISFDTYFQTASNSTWPYPQANAKSEQVKGMPTGSRTKVLGTASTYLYSLPLYDEKGRVIQSQSTNITGGVDIATTQYTWAGQPLVAVSKQQLATGTGQSTVTVTQLTYDDLGRVIKTEKKLSNTLVNAGAMAAYKTIAENKYDKLGQLVKKNIGNKPAASAGTPLAKLEYEYNIRGWLTSVNKNFVTAGNTGANNDEYFGMQLGYDKDAFGNFTKKEYNGNIAGSIWRSAGDGIDRKYDYDYDAANRLLKADFTQHDGNAFVINPTINFDVKMGDGIDPNQAYDYNGNILKMQQWGLKINNSEKIDNLVYEYQLNSNKLAKVTDVNTVASTNGKLGDFKDGTNTNDDYLYDANGNMIVDQNKKILAIEYNHLNLPKSITVEPPSNWTSPGAHRIINYIYDAAGNKLQKQVLENTAPGVNKNITTTYINGLVYESKATNEGGAYDPAENYTGLLQFVPQEEGRVRFKPAVLNTSGTLITPASFEYDYMLKDHLGNVRVVITEEQQQDIYPAATLEPALVGTESGFYAIDASKIVPNSAANELRDINNNAQTYQNNNLPLANNNPSCGNGSICTTDNSGNVYKLNGNVNNAGLGITLRVMAGDKIDVLGKSYYYQNNPTPNTAPLNPVTILNILSGFLGGATGGAATNIHGSVSATDINTTDGTNIITNGLFTNQNNQTTNTSKPRAFLNYIFFDDQFKAVASGASVVGNNKELKNHLQDLQGLVAPKNGFLYVYVSNESAVDVFFDNVQVKHVRSSLLSEDHYYPFGERMFNICSVSAGAMDNKKKYNGIEFNNDLDINTYEAQYRDLDPQTGRWWQIDPKVEDMYSWSTYASNYDNPIRYEDKLGDVPNEAGVCCPGAVEIYRSAVTTSQSYGPYGKVIVVGGAIVAGLYTLFEIVDEKNKSNAANPIQGNSITTGPSYTMGTTSSSKASTAQQRADKLSQNDRSGKDMTKAGKDAVKEVNKEKNNGKTVCENCGTQTIPANQSKTGVTPPNNETHVDHINPKSKGGSGTPNNGQILCRGCNLDKAATPPTPLAPLPPATPPKPF